MPHCPRRAYNRGSDPRGSAGKLSFRAPRRGSPPRLPHPGSGRRLRRAVVQSGSLRNPHPRLRDLPQARMSRAQWHPLSVKREVGDRSALSTPQASCSPPGLPSYILLLPRSSPEALRPAPSLVPIPSLGGEIRPGVNEVLLHGSYLTIFSLLTIQYLLCCVFVQSAQPLQKSSKLLQSSPYVRSCF